VNEAVEIKYRLQAVPAPGPESSSRYARQFLHQWALVSSGQSRFQPVQRETEGQPHGGPKPA